MYDALNMSAGREKKLLLLSLNKCFVKRKVKTIKDTFFSQIVCIIFGFRHCTKI